MSTTHPPKLCCACVAYKPHGALRSGSCPSESTVPTNLGDPISKIETVAIRAAADKKTIIEALCVLEKPHYTDKMFGSEDDLGDVTSMAKDVSFQTPSLISEADPTPASQVPVSSQLVVRSSKQTPPSTSEAEALQPDQLTPYQGDMSARDQPAFDVLAAGSILQTQAMSMDEESGSPADGPSNQAVAAAQSDSEPAAQDLPAESSTSGAEDEEGDEQPQADDYSNDSASGTQGEDDEPPVPDDGVEVEDVPEESEEIEDLIQRFECLSIADEPEGIDWDALFE